MKINWVVVDLWGNFSTEKSNSCGWQSKKQCHMRKRRNAGIGVAAVQVAHHDVGVFG
jgi:uncharacterized protein YbbK (DUF523 family)